MKIFISSTFRDLEEERAKIHHSLKKAGLESFGMEFFVAEPCSSKEVCLREVENSDLVLLIVADNYGTIDQQTQKSFTHLEFDKARESKREILAFLQKEPVDLNVIKFQEEIKTSGITVDFFENKNEVLNVLFPALFKYILSKGLIKNKTKTFLNFSEFYAMSLQKHALFNYSQKFIGRKQELDQLNNFLADPNQQVVIVNAAGGTGKSKLVYEYALGELSNPKWDFRFIPWQVNTDNNSIGELSANNTCVVIEDAHKQKDLSSLVYTILGKTTYSNKVIVTTRPSGIASIQEALRDYNPNETINLGRLSKNESIELAKSILHGDKQDYANAIYKAANGNTLVVIMASELVQNDKLNGTLITDNIFREKVLDKLLSELDRIDNKGIDLKVLMATIAGLLPFKCEPESIELLAKYINTEKYKLNQVLDELETQGFVIKIVNRLRVIPDILADYILWNHAVNSKREPTGFIENLFEIFGKIYLENILINISELEYNENIYNLSGIVWQAINQKLQNYSLQDLSSILKTIETVSYLSPEKVYEIVCNILKNTKKIKDYKDYAEHEYQSVLNSINKILFNLGRRPEYTKRVCLLLWDLVIESQDIEKPQCFIENPCNYFEKLTSFDNHNWSSVQMEALAAIKEIINSGKHKDHELEISKILESPLKPEVETQTCDKRTFSWGWFCIYDVKEEALQRVVEIRKEALNLYAVLIDKLENRALYQIAQEVIKKLYHPYLRGELKNKAEAEFEREAILAVELLKKIIVKKIPVLNNCIYELVFNGRKLLLKNIKIDDILSEKIKYNYDVFYCIKNDWPEDYAEDFEKTDQLFKEIHDQTAITLWGQCDNNPEKLFRYILDYRKEMEDYGISCGNYAFLIACAKVKPELCSKAIDVIIKQNNIDYIASMASIWVQYAPENQQYQLVHNILIQGNQYHKVSIAGNISCFMGLSEEELITVVENMSKIEDSEVRDVLIRGLGRICRHRIKEGVERIIDVLCGYDTKNDNVRLEILFGNINTHYFDLAILTNNHVASLMDKIKHVKKLEGYHIGRFLCHIINERPLDCISVILWRIQNRNSGDGQPFPYNEGFHEKPVNFVNHPDYSQCIIDVLNAMKDYEWNTYFWCPTLIRWLDPNFSEITQKILLDNLHLHKNALQAITYIFVHYERKYFFSNIEFVNTLLRESETLDKDDCENVKSKLAFMPFSGMRQISGLGKPDDLSLYVIEQCNRMLEDESLPVSFKEFYRNMIKSAEYQDQKKRERDQLELAEEEF